MTDSIEARVARGAEYLDRRQPGWERRIDLARLEMRLACQCVAGQVFGDFFALFEDHNRENPENHRWGMNYGFQAKRTPWTGGVDSIERDGDYADLQTAWTELIKARFNGGLLSDEPGDR